MELGQPISTMGLPMPGGGRREEPSRRRLAALFLVSAALLGLAYHLLRSSDEDLDAHPTDVEAVAAPSVTENAAPIAAPKVVPESSGVQEATQAAPKPAARDPSGTCGVDAKTVKPDCDHVDNGSCGNACCTMDVVVPGVEPKVAYEALAKYLISGGGDGLFAKGSNRDEVGNLSEDDQGDYPQQFTPPLPWHYTTSGTHTTAGHGYVDQLRFSVGTDASGARVRLFSLSTINGALGDAGQNYKTLSVLRKGLDWPAEKIVYGCGTNQ